MENQPEICKFQNLFRDKTSLVILLFSIATSLFTLLLFYLYFHFLCFEQDAVSYLFQARLFAQGKIAADIVDIGFIPSEHINFANNLAFTKYPFANSLILVPGIWLGIPWIIPVLLTGLGVFFLAWTVRERFGKKPAFITALLCSISPAVTCLGATYFSEVSSRFFLVLFIFFFHRSFLNTSKWHPFFCGLMLGFSFNCRPLTCLVFAFCTFSLFVFLTIKNKKPRQLLSRFATFIPGFLIMLTCTFLWNGYFTGNPFKFPFSLNQPYDQLGFGRKGMGKNIAAEGLPLYTPQIALERLYKNTIPCLAYNTFGWGNYFHTRGTANHAETGVLIGSTKKTEAITFSVTANGSNKYSCRIKTQQQTTLANIEKIIEVPDSGPVFLGINRENRNLIFSLGNEKLKSPVIIHQIPDHLEAPYVLGIFQQGKTNLNLTALSIAPQTGKHQRHNLTLKLSPDWQISTNPEKQHYFASSIKKTPFASIKLELEPKSKNIKFDLVKLLPVALIICLIIIAYRKKEQLSWLILMGVLICVNIFAYCFYFFDGSTMDYTPVASRYHNEVTLIAIIPLCALGLASIIDSLKSAKLQARTRKILKGMLILAGILLLLNSIYTYNRYALHLRNWNNNCQLLPRLVQQQKLSNAIIFVHTPMCTPLSDYPFESMEKASIIYYRLGKFPRYGIEEDNWRKVHQKYFPKRKAYFYSRRKLTRLK